MAGLVMAGLVWSGLLGLSITTVNTTMTHFARVEIRVVHWCFEGATSCNSDVERDAVQTSMKNEKNQ